LTEIVLIDNILDIDVIPQKLFQNKNVKIFSLSLEAHDKLESDKIIHDIADELLTEDERLQLFDKSLEFLSWPSRVSSDDLKFEGVNLLQIFDTHEFHSYLMPILVKLLTVKRIIEKENPAKIICTNSLSNIVQSVIQDSIESEFFPNNVEQKLLWDTITIKYNLGSIPISINLSKNNYLKIKKFVESTLGFFYGFWIDGNSPKQKSIIFLEFNTEYFSTLLKSLKTYDGNIILVNRRRSAVWSMTATNIVRKSGCKVLNFENILNKDEKHKIHLLVDEYTKKIEKLWENSKFLNDVFQIENCSFWNVIKAVIMKKYSEKLSEFIFLVCSAKNIFKNMDVRCIVSLNEIGETEKAFLEFNNKKIPSILLEHGFVERVDDTKRFDQLLYVHFKDNIAVWGDKKKEYLIHEYGIHSDKIIVTGSPRHDIYFNSRMKKSQSQEITVLLAPNPITEISGLASTNLELKFENTIKEIISILKKFDNVKIIVKLHQIQLKHNREIYSLIKKIDNTIPVYSSVSVIETINSADAVIVISSERFGTSTILLESIILGKPTMNIILDDKIPEFTHVKEKAILTISNNSDLEKNFKKILFDTDFRNELIKNADAFVEKFMSYRGNASEKFASVLKSF
jgi:hypothetical protein